LETTQFENEGILVELYHIVRDRFPLGDIAFEVNTISQTEGK
jgi:hypothetical protein